MDVLDAFLEQLAAKLAPKVAALLVAPPPAERWATARDNPLGTRHGFLAAAKRSEFPSFKRGRERVARWTDVEAYLQRRQAAPRKAAPPARLDAGSRRRELLRGVGALRKVG